MKPKFDIHVKWEEEDSPDTSWLGEFTSRPKNNEAYIDRRTDVFVNPNVWFNIAFDTEEKADEFIDKIESLGIPWTKEEEKDSDIIVQHAYYEELPFSCHYERNEFEYYVSCNYPNPKPDEYQYFIADCKQLEKYGDTWWMKGCIVKAYLQGIELGNASLWGIESDSDEGYFKETEEDLTAQAIDEAKKNLEKILSAIKE